jgi:hypothetical protein
LIPGGLDLAASGSAIGKQSASKNAVKRAQQKEKKRKLAEGGLPSRGASNKAKQKMKQQRDIEELEEEQCKRAKVDNNPPPPSEQDQVKQALLISFYNTLHIDVLYEWAADYDTFEATGLTKDEQDRDDITSWLIDNSVAPKSEEDAVENWRNRSDDVGVDDPAPRRRIQALGAAASNAAAASAAPPVSSLPARKTFVVPTSDADLDLTATPAHCGHCGMARVVGGLGTTFPCGTCFYISGKMAGSAVNSKESVALRAQAANFKVQAEMAASSAAAAAATSSSSSSGGGKDDTTSTNKLSAADKELERLAADGAPYPRFLDSTPISAAEALLAVRRSHNGPLYAHGSPSLHKLIRSGKFMELSLAVPRTALETMAAKDRDQHGDTVKLGADGRLSTSAALHHRPLHDFSSFMDAFFTNIGPALYDNPSGLLDWFLLARSVINMMKAGDSWDLAYKYMVTTLNEKVPLRLPFGDFDMRIMHAVAPPFNHSSNNNNSNNNYSNSNNSYYSNHHHGGSSSSSSPPPASGSSDRDSHSSFLNLTHPECCRKWNLMTCKEPCPARRKHSCLWLACNDSTIHTGKECKSNPGPRGRLGAPPSKQARFDRRA